MKELRDVTVSARIKPRAKRIMENSKYSYGDAIEYFAFNVVDKTEDKRQRLKHLQIESRQMTTQLKAYEMEIDILSKELGINPEDDLFFAEEIRKSIKAVLRWFNREKKQYKTIENFLNMKTKKIKYYADESGLEHEEFVKRVISAHYARDKDQTNK